MSFSRTGRLLLPLVFFLAVGSLSHAQIGPTPIPGLSVEIADVIDFPDTRNLAQDQTEDSRVDENIARINFLRELPDASNRWFVNDLRGDRCTWSIPPPTDVAVVHQLPHEFSRFRYGSSGLSTGLISVTPHPQFATNGKLYTVHTEINTGSPAPDFIAQGNAGNITGSNSMHSVITEWTAT